MSYATLLVYVNVDHVPKQLVSVAAGLADKFSAKLIGLSALAIMPPFAADGVVMVDNATIPPRGEARDDRWNMRKGPNANRVPSCR